MDGSRSPYARGLLLCAFLMGIWVSPLISGVFGQENYEIQVYDSETEAPGKIMIELHSNMAIKGTTQKTEGVLPTEHALHETLEITYGLTPWFETGFYTFTSIQPGMGWEWVGDHIRPKVRVPDSWDWPVGVALSTEFGYQRRKFSTDTWSIEIRPIIDKQMGRWYLSFNPVLARPLKGVGASQGFEFSPNFKISYEFSSRLSGGFEYYGSFGPLSGFDPLKEQHHQIFPTVDLNLGPEWEFNFGVGIGLTSSTDRILVKMILGRRF